MSDEYYDRSAHIFKDQLLSLGQHGETLTQTFDRSADQWKLTYRSSDRARTYERWFRSQPTYETVMTMLKQCRMSEVVALAEATPTAQQFKACDAWMYDLG